MGGAALMGAVLVVILGITAYLIGTTIRSIQNEKRTKMRLWKNFGLSLRSCFIEKPLVIEHRDALIYMLPTAPRHGS